jgi:alpha-beta hydrolase superfamily lysophospholipase
MAAMTAHDGIELRVRADEPASAPRARIVLIHGIGDQVDGVPYVTAAAALSARGFSVRRLELRGHGLSGGRRAYVPSWGDFRSDLGRFVDQTAAERPALPVFLAGISMGGLIVTNYAVHRPEGLRGVIALAPALGDTGGSRVLLAMLPVLSRVVPALPIDPKLDLSRLTRDAGMQRAYVADPLYQRRVTPRIAAELLKAIAETRSRAAGFRVPLLILHGTADTLTSPSGSAEFFERAGVADKTYRRYEGAYHNLFVETNREEIYDDIAAWIDARAEAAP